MYKKIIRNNFTIENTGKNSSYISAHISRINEYFLILQKVDETKILSASNEINIFRIRHLDDVKRWIYLNL